MPPRLQAVMSALTQSDHVFLGLPRVLEHGTSILVTDLIQDEDRTTCPYHLRRIEQLSPPVFPALHTTNQWGFHHVALRHRSIGSLICHFGIAVASLEWSGPKFHFHEEEQSGHRRQGIYGLCREILALMAKMTSRQN